MNVTDCPESIVGFDGEIDGVPNAELTVTLSVAEYALSGVVAESVTS